MTIAVITIFAIVGLFLLLSMRTLAVTGVPVVHSTPDVVRTAFDCLALRDGERFCEIGSAFGGVLIAARKRADVQVEGLELNPALVVISWLRTIRDRRIRVRLTDARRADLRSPDAVFTFLMPHALALMSGILEEQLKEGARVASVDFPIPGWLPAEEHQCRGGHAVYFYVMGRHRPLQSEERS